MRFIFSLLLLVISMIYGISIANCYIVDPGPKVRATKGEIWPKPKYQISSDLYSIVRNSIFEFQVIGHNCDLLEHAKIRYLRIIHYQTRRHFNLNRMSGGIQHKFRVYESDKMYQGFLNNLQINLTSPCEDYPYLNMDESYTIKVQNGNADLESSSIWGVLRGLETFSQLLYIESNDKSLRINLTEIHDEPRFAHRGLLIDTSRHFLSLFTIYNIIDGMSYNKLNVLHWHIVDDQSFPYQSSTFPELSQEGAYDPDVMIYSQSDVANIIEYARMRGIRVIPEFDTPGHTRSWGVSHPEILTECFGEYVNKLGPIDPTKNETYIFVQKLFKEVTNVFPDKYFHLGGDEVGFECWESNGNISDFMKLLNITTYNQLEEIYIQHIVDFVTKLNIISIVWQEVYQNGVHLPNTTVVHVWEGEWRSLLKTITEAGYQTLLSTCWYLDHLSTGGDWKKFYSCDPHDFNGTRDELKRVMGGEACMWAEVVDNSNIISRIFPRVSAVAEKLWSQFDVQDVTNAEKRLEEHTCRMKIRGIDAQPPNGPGFCY